MAKELNCRPSALLDVQDSVTAFYVDRASFYFAGEVNSEMDAAENRLPDNAKARARMRARQRVLDRYLGIEASEEPERFRSAQPRG